MSEWFKQIVFVLFKDSNGTWSPTAFAAWIGFAGVLASGIRWGLNSLTRFRERPKVDVSMSLGWTTKWSDTHLVVTVINAGCTDITISTVRLKWRISGECGSVIQELFREEERSLRPQTAFNVDDINPEWKQSFHFVSQYKTRQSTNPMASPAEAEGVGRAAVEDHLMSLVRVADFESFQLEVWLEGKENKPLWTGRRECYDKLKAFLRTLIDQSPT